MKLRQVVASAALAAFCLTVLCVAASAAAPSVSGVVQGLHQDAKGKLVAFSLQAKDAKGKAITLKIGVTAKTKYSLGAACATVRALQAKAKVTVTLVAAPKAGKGTASAVKVTPPPSARPLPRMTGG